MRKKITIISLLAYPIFMNDKNVIHGGSEFALTNIAKNLDKDKFHVDFIIGDFGQEKTTVKDGLTIYRGPKVKNVGIFGGIANFIKLFILIFKINPDIIMSSSAGWLIVELVIIKMILGKKYVFRSSHKNNINGFTDNKGYGFLYRKLMDHIDCIILQNDEDWNVLKKNFDYKGKIVRIRNIQPIPNEKPLDFSQRKHILWVGRSEKIKKPELFLNIAKLVPDKKFLMIMPETDTQVFKRISNLAKQIKNLRIIPGIERKNIMDFYKESEYLISTSEGEGFPNVIVEAMKSGTPVISSLDYDNIIKQNNCGFIADDSEAISKLIIGTRKDKWDVQSTNSWNFSINNFDIRKGIKQYEDLFS